MFLKNNVEYCTDFNLSKCARLYFLSGVSIIAYTNEAQIQATALKINHMAVGVCGLSCRLCLAFHRETKSKCLGCKSKFRMNAACTYLNCAVKKKGVEFCWECNESSSCARWKKHSEFGMLHDSFVCYQKVEDNIASIRKSGIKAFEEQEEAREKLLDSMLKEFDEGRSKSFYCIAATVLEIEELENAIRQARLKSQSLAIKEKAQVMHLLLNEVAEERNYNLKLRK